MNMPFQLSPGVNVSEIDLTTVVPAVASTAGAVAGAFRWGPLNERVLVSSEDELVKTFGKPNTDTSVSFFTAANFLQYGNTLRVVRVADETTALNATNESGGGELIQNEDAYNSMSGTIPAGRFWAAKYPGVLGNALEISTCATDHGYSAQHNDIQTVGTTLTFNGVNVIADHMAIGDKIISGGETRYVVDIDAVNNEAELNAAFSADITSGGALVEWAYADQFDGAPGTSDFAANLGATNDEIHVIVIDKTGALTGTAGTVLEKFAFLSVAGNAKSTTGANNYYADVLNQSSKYVWWIAHDTSSTTWGDDAEGGVNFDDGTDERPSTSTFNGGVDGSAPADADKIRGYELFKNGDIVDVSLLLGADANQTVALKLIEIAESRKDCVAFLSPELADCVNNGGSEVEDVVAFRNTLGSSSYAFLDSSWKYMYDKYNDKYRWVPMNGDTAGLCVRTDQQRDPWFSPAGLNRGQILNIVKASWNPDKTDRDALYKNGVNPIVAFPGDGTVLFGDKTLQAKPSAFDRINVRRLFIVIEKAIATAAKYSLFEFNDEFTRNSFVSLVAPFLRDVQGRRGIYDFRVVCDETNNTGEVIDRNEFVGDIYVKPARSINFIQLNFVAVRTGVDFSEVVGNF
jgi:phage tail sheath protein FI